jgi:hypothetical protein
MAAAFIALGAAQLWIRSHPRASLLSRPVASIDFRDVPLEDGIKQLGTAAGVAIVIDRDGLKADHIELLSESVSLRVDQMELGMALSRLDAGWFRQCAINERGNELYIIPIDDMPAVARIYDLTDIIDRWQAMAHIQEDAGPHTGSYGSPPPPLTREALVSEIVSAMQSTVDRDNWGPASGAGPARGAIEPVGTKIIVVCSEPVHRLVASFLREFRKSAPERPGT